MKKSFLTGLAILMPVALTIMLFAFLIDLFTAPFLGIVTSILKQHQDEHVLLKSPELTTLFARIIILIFLVIIMLFLGWITRWYFIRIGLSLANRVIVKIPFIKSIYKISRDIFSALFSTAEGKKAFKYPVFFPFPSFESYVIGFKTGEVPELFEKKVNQKLECVFIPTAPHPISGYLMLMPPEYVHKIDMTNEEAVKYTVSCGVIIPEEDRVVVKD